MSKISYNSDNEELYIVNSILISPDTYYDNANKLSSSDFGSPAGLVYKCFEELVMEGKDLTTPAVMRKAQENGVSSELDPVLASKSIGKYVVSDCVKQILRASKARSILSVCEKAINGLHSHKDPDEVERGLMSNISSSDVSDDVSRPYELLAEITQDSKDRKSRDQELYGVPIFGIHSLDYLIGGGELGDLIGVAARPKMGKSSVENTVYRNFAKMGIPIMGISGEMSRKKRTLRLLAAVSGVPTNEIATGKYLESPDKIKKFEEAKEEIRKSGDLFMSDGEMSIKSITALIYKCYHRYGVEYFMIDRVGLFDEIINSRGNDNVARTMVLSALRRIAKTLNVCIVIFSQVNGDAEKTSHKRPFAHQIYGATALQANCTKALLIYRPEFYGLSTFRAGKYKGQKCKGFAEFILCLSNNTDTGSVKIKFNSDIQLFYGLDDEPEEEHEDHFDQLSMPEVVSEDDLPF